MISWDMSRQDQFSKEIRDLSLQSLLPLHDEVFGMILRVEIFRLKDQGLKCVNSKLKQLTTFFIVVTTFYCKNYVYLCCSEQNSSLCIQSNQEAL